MRTLTVVALRTVIIALLAGSVFVQTVMVPLIAQDLDVETGLADRQVPIIVIVLLGIVSCQVILVCTWRLVGMVAGGTVFSPGAFRFVDVVIGATVAAAAITGALGVVLAPGEEVAPGVVLLIGGVMVAILGVALVEVVLRMLLAQAVDRDSEARRMRAELDEVI